MRYFWRLCSLLALSCVAPAFAAEFKVLSVGDGDTIRVTVTTGANSSGAAFVYWQYIEGCDRETYSRLENEARLKSLGVWAVPGGIQRPCDYRRGRKAGSGTSSSSSSSSSSGKYRCMEIGSWDKAKGLCSGMTCITLGSSIAHDTAVRSALVVERPLRSSSVP